MIGCFCNGIEFTQSHVPVIISLLPRIPSFSLHLNHAECHDDVKTSRRSTTTALQLTIRRQRARVVYERIVNEGEA